MFLESEFIYVDMSEDLQEGSMYEEDESVDGSQEGPETENFEDLLRKLEEQNRQIESDAKAKTTIPRGLSVEDGPCSPSSSPHQSISEHGEDCMEEDDAWLTWGEIIRSWDDIMRRKQKKIKDLVRRGVPNPLRGMVWQRLCQAYESELKERYAELIKINSACERMIRRDIARTFPEHSFFREENGVGQETLFNVIKAYSIYDKEVGYCQGSAFIVGILLMQMPEEEAFCVFVKLMLDYKMRELFKPSMAELGLCIFQLETLVKELVPELQAHFNAQGFHTAMYASSWFLTLFAAIMPLSASFRVMDMFLSEGREALFRIGIALLQLSQDELLQLDMEGMLKHFQKDMPQKYETDTDILMETACHVKYNAKKMKKLERDYTRVKIKEAEDSEEIRRLKMENTLLLQRNDELEKECQSLADRLIQGQVTRATEQEDIFVIKRELAALRRHDADTMEALEEARRRIEELTMFKTHIIGELQERSEDSQPTEKDIQVIALRAELSSAKLQQHRLNQENKKLKESMSQEQFRDRLNSNPTAILKKALENAENGQNADSEDEVTAV